MPDLFAQGQEVLKGRMKPELHQPVVEIGTEICNDIDGARRDVRRRVTIG